MTSTLPVEGSADVGAAVLPSDDSWLKRAARFRPLRIIARGFIVAFAVATVAFSIIRLAPGDPVLAILGDQATPEAADALRAQLGLDGNVFFQYLKYLGDFCLLY